MSYSYDRTDKTAAAVMFWGFPMLLWMEQTTTLIAKELNAHLGGRVSGPRNTTKGGYGCYCLIEEAGFPGDLEGTVYIAINWWKDQASLRIWAEHPQRGSVDLVKQDLGWADRPDYAEAIAKIKNI